MVSPDLKQTIQAMLPQLIAEDPLIRDFVLRTVSNYYAGKEETESKFDRVLAKLERDREEQARKWDESTRQWEENTRQWHEQHQANMAALARMDQHQEEQARKWDESTRQWEENNRQWHEQHQQNMATLARIDQQQEESTRQWHEQHQQNMAAFDELKRHDRRYESTIGALGARWGLYSEASFRNALKGILADSFGVQVLNLNLYDHEGEVFGRPDQIELDLIVKNGTTIACEIKSSIDKAGMYSFGRKVDFYAKHEQRQINRKIVISPMVDDRALPVAEALGIEVYSYADAVETL
ncbi:MAG: PD-(D/E)XK nuclease family protein [Nodosilinea sp.]